MRMEEGKQLHEVIGWTVAEENVLLGWDIVNGYQRAGTHWTVRDYGSVQTANVIQIKFHLKSDF